MLLPADLRQKLTPGFVSCLPADSRRKVLELLEQRRSIEVRRCLIRVVSALWI